MKRLLKRLIKISIVLLIIASAVVIYFYNDFNIDSNNNISYKYQATKEKKDNGKMTVINEVIPNESGTDPLVDTWKDRYSFSSEDSLSTLEKIKLRVKLIREAIYGNLPEDENGYIYKFLKYFGEIKTRKDIISIIMLAAKTSAICQRIYVNKIQKPTPEINELFTKANNCYENINLNEAIMAYNSILRKNRFHMDARNNLGLAYMHDGNDKLALFHFQFLSIINPRYSGAKINIALALFRLGMDDLAYDQLNKNNLDDTLLAQYNLAWLENSRCNYEKADHILNKLNKLYPDNHNVKRLMVLNRLENGIKPTKNQLDVFSDDEKERLIKINISKIKVVKKKADLLDHEYRIRDQVKLGSVFIVSQYVDGWYGVYHKIDNKKMTLWINEKDVKRY